MNLTKAGCQWSRFLAQVNWLDIDLKLSYFNSLHKTRNPLEPLTVRAIKCRKRGTLRTHIYIIYHASSQCLLDFTLLSMNYIPILPYFPKNYPCIWYIKCIKAVILLLCHHIEIEHHINRYTRRGGSISRQGHLSPWFYFPTVPTASSTRQVSLTGKFIFQSHFQNLNGYI